MPAAERLELAHGGLEVRHDGSSRLIEVRKARTSRRLNRAYKRIRKSGATIPGATRRVDTASPASAVRSRPGPRYGRPNSTKRSQQPAAYRSHRRP